MVDYSKIAMKYSLFRRTSPPVVTSLIELDNISKSSKVLEVGFGSGNYIGELKALTDCVC